MTFAYYPGCSAGSTALEYEQSLKESLNYLGVGLKEIPNWNCCGASSAHVVNHELAIALPARNIALAEKMGLDIVTPCAACFLRLKFAQYKLKNDPDLKDRIEKDIGGSLNLSQNIKHVMEILHDDVGINIIKEKIQKSLRGLKVVTYYGCYLVRPPEIIEFDDPENPVRMDEIMRSMDVEVIDWSYKVSCCGGTLSLTKPEIAESLVSKICFSASEVGADAIVTACPLCQSNLDVRQQKDGDLNKIPIFFLSEITAIALGSSRVKKWCKKHIVNPSSLLQRLRLL